VKIKTVMDKVELRIPSRAEFSKDFAAVYRALSSGSRPHALRAGLHYSRVGDLRLYGYQAILHMYCTHGREGNHKLELLNAGEMSYVQIGREVERIFNVDPSRLSVMRIDLAADVRDVPVIWFAQHLRAKWKRAVCEIGLIEYSQMGPRELQTFYLGKRPNCFRVYDKIAELRKQYTLLCRGVSPETKLPTFEQTYGYPTSGCVLTRVERQIGGSRIPPQIGTFGKLRSLPSFDPFDRLEISPGPVADHEPNIEGYGLKDYLAGLGLRNRANELGMHRLRAWVNKHSPGNASRFFKKYVEFLPSGDGGIDTGELFRLYVNSVGRQLAS